MNTTLFFLGVLVLAFLISAIACTLALFFFPWFRSGERKEGTFRPDQSTGTYRIDTRKGVQKVQIAHAGSNELPLLGGPAMMLAIILATLVSAILLRLDLTQWEMLGVLLFGMLGFGAVGFLDDWRKVHSGEGISEIQKFLGVVVIAAIVGVLLNRLLTYPAVPQALSARLAYPPYRDIPGLGHLLVEAKLAWVIFFLLMTIIVSSATALAVDFSDGMDGLCGGLLFSASLSFAAILLGEGNQSLWPAAIAMLAITGATGGFLPFNWPSSWKARNQGRGARRARIIMGDSGSLALGGLLAFVALISRLELILPFIGGVFVLEGLSALISARILVRFFRKFLRLERYNSSGRGFLHTEFPLPFLATPMHHHYDLLGWDRKRLVYGAWLLGAGLGILGVASVIGVFTWQRYLARFAALLVIVLVWQSGPWTRSFFIGLTQPIKSPVAAPAHLGLYYGFPFRLFGRRLYGRVDTVSITEEVFRTPAEQLSLWQRMSVFDARAVLGYYCYRAGAYDDALRVWGRIPKGNLAKRPEIEEMLAEVRHTIALRLEGQLDERTVVAAPADPANGLDPNATLRAQPIPYELTSNGHQTTTERESQEDAPSVAGLHPILPYQATESHPMYEAHDALTPAGEQVSAASVDMSLPSAEQPVAPFWTADSWAAAHSSEAVAEPTPVAELGSLAEPDNDSWLLSGPPSEPNAPDERVLEPEAEIPTEEVPAVSAIPAAPAIEEPTQSTESVEAVAPIAESNVHTLPVLTDDEATTAPRVTVVKPLLQLPSHIEPPSEELPPFVVAQPAPTSPPPSLIPRLSPIIPRLEPLPDEEPEE